MVKPLLLLYFILFTSLVKAQISSEYSSVQTISYFAIGDKQYYKVEKNAYKIKGEDTLTKSKISYDVDITVLDSGANFYIIEWKYTNLKANTNNKILDEVATLSEDMRAVIKTSELGEVISLENWKEIKKKSKKFIKKSKKKFPKNTFSKEVLSSLERNYRDEKGIFNNAIKDVHLYFNFHGGKYTMGESYDAIIKMPNIYNDSIDMALSVYLDNINDLENNYVIRMMQTANAEQLKDAAYKYMLSLNKLKKDAQPIKKSDIPPITNEINTAARIHTTGWVMYIIELKEVFSEEITKIDETIIELR